MPRLLPRLLKIALPSPPSVKFEPFNHSSSRPRSLRKPVPQTPSFNPSEYPQSILLTTTNPITSSRDYVQHKTMPPHLRRVAQRSKKNEYDEPRTMNAEEREWWSSPYLRILSSPTRKCILTGAYLPKDFLIRLALMRLPPSRLHPKKSLQTIIVPDGLEHPKFRVRRSGKAHYILCWKDAVYEFSHKKSAKRFKGNVVHSLLEKQIRHLLCLRVLQELTLLVEQSERRVDLSQPPIIRKLTRREFLDVQQTGIIPYQNAVALLVVPPLNRNPITKQRPLGSMSSLPGNADIPIQEPKRPLPPLSTLHSTIAQGNQPDTLVDIESHSQCQVPLYHGLALFPDREQRMTLHRLLSRLLAIERKIEHTTALSNKRSGDDKDSHAYVLHSDAEITQRGDVASVAVGLWRLRMFEGGSWEENTQWYTTQYRSREIL